MLGFLNLRLIQIDSCPRIVSNIYNELNYHYIFISISQVFEKNGTIRFQFGTSGKEEGQLWYPRKVAVMKASGKYVVCDRGNERSRMQIFSKNGHFLKKIAIRY